MFERSASRLVGKTWSAFSPAEQLIVAAGCVLCGFVFLGLGHVLDIPRSPGFQGSLLAGGSPIFALALILFGVPISMAVGDLVVGAVEHEAGLFCTAVGLTALSVRGGAMPPVLQYASGPSVFFSLTAEIVLLFGMLVGAWLLFDRILRKRADPSDAPQPFTIEVKSEPKDLVTATVLQAVIMALCELVLLQTDSKKQALVAVGLAAFIGTIVAYQLVPLSSGLFYWIGPALVGLVGYLAGNLYPETLSIAQPGGALAALARATPLDYAGIGVAAALLGFWSSRRWAYGDEEPAPAATQS